MCEKCYRTKSLNLLLNSIRPEDCFPLTRREYLWSNTFPNLNSS
jgi:hypothetical protein